NAEDELLSLAQAAEAGGHERLHALLNGDGPLRSFLGAIVDLSSYMRDSAQLMPQSLEGLFDRPLAERLVHLNVAIDAAAFAEGATEASVMRALRRLKREAHFLIALGNLAGESSAATTVKRLTTLADCCVRSA